MIDLYDTASDRFLGTISDADLDVLKAVLEEESSDDQDYYIDETTIDLLRDGGASGQLLELLQSSLGSGEGLEVRWQRR